MDMEAAKSRGRDVAPWVERFSRIGYVAKGVVYLLVGVLAIRAAFGPGQAEDTGGALRSLLGQPFGQVLLIAIGVGLLGYTVWRLAEGIFNVDNKDDDAKGYLKRVVYVFSGIAYGGLALEAFQLVMGRAGGGGGQAQETWTARALGLPFGRWLVAAAALALAGVAVNAIYIAFSGKFREKLKEAEMSSKTRPWAAAVGSAGLVARGLVFLVIAFFLAQAAWQFDPQEAGGSAEALAFIAGLPYGAWLLSGMGLGMMAYGAYALFQARYREMHIG